MAEPRASWMPPVPGPLQRLFDFFPLVTYPANDLPSRTPAPSDLPALYVFVSEEGARRGSPSFNPSCLKWQTLLRITDTPHRLVSSTNHASPTGALPFLLPAPPPPPARKPAPVPASRLPAYAAAHGRRAAPAPRPPRAAAYQALVDGPLRAAWLRALYLEAANAPLLRALYVGAATRSAAVGAALERTLRRAAEAEVVAAAGAAGAAEVYAAAAAALDALAALLAESGTGWFFGAAGPGEFDTAVFAYAQPLLAPEAEAGLAWGDGRLGEMARGAGGGELARHRARMWDLLWGPDW